MNLLFCISSLLMIITSSGAYVQLLKDGGARDQGLENYVEYTGPLNSLPTLWILSALCVLVIVLLTGKARKIRIGWPILFLLLLSFISASWADVPYIAIRTSVLMLLTVMLIYAHVSICGVNKASRFIRNVLLLILGSSLLLALFVPSWGISIGVQQEGKWQGVFDQKNVLGNFAAMSFLFAVWRQRIERSWLNWALALLSIFLEVMSQSGTGMAGLAIVMIINLMFCSKYIIKFIYKFRFLILILALMLSVGAVFMALTFEQFNFLGKDSSFTGRDLIWVYVLMKMSSAPILGYGVDQLGAQINVNPTEFLSNVGYLVGSAHNGFLETAFSLGALGIFLVISVFWKAISVKEREKSFSLIFPFLIFMIVLNTFEARLVSFNIYFVMLMYSIVLSRFTEKEEQGVRHYFQNKYSNTRLYVN